ncbi:MAG: hypothetical protein VR74_17530 [Hyphomonas sp. BRH_c22]|uniref:terminase large subunit domain-containing protein n=1 Tax=Hyphomonas sp. BRH_c22 TaxID=1629710 RepID=UPI0005F1308F|nr:terminase family protein [Hyphomonas sp. BRH_c22]KJS35164.1 MAG: hypothetical protein VR74_17530 [Hyphomonas sp. BRH_c22]
MDRLSPFQASVLQTPRELNLALLGARGGGKSTAAVALIARDLQEYGEDASVLVVRRTLRALSDFEEELLRLIGLVSGGTHSYNRAEKILRWNGGKVTLAAIERAADYDKLQGKSFHLIIVEEVTQYPSERVLRLLRSNLRAAPGVPTRVVYLGNPGGPLHGRIFDRHVKDRRSHVPYTVDGEHWATINSGPADNPFIDLEDYITRLREACHGDAVRLSQWLFGDWTRGEGLMWPQFSTEKHVISVAPHSINGDVWAPVVGIDWGLSSPSVAHLALRAKRDLHLFGRTIPRDSVLILDEVTDLIGTPGIDENLNKSSEWPPSRLGERAASMCANWGVHKPSGVVDNARGLSGDDVIEEIRKTGKFWSLTLPRKGRRAERHALMASMLQAAAESNPHRPHLYISDNCQFLIHAISNSVRDERDPDDVADTPGCPDHPLDSAQYAIAQHRIRRTLVSSVTGLS